MGRNLLICSLLALAAISGAQSNRLSVQDRTFMRKAAQGGLAEVQMGRVASRRGLSSDVRNFGNRMVSDHSKANQDLMSIARRLRVSLPTTVGGEEAAGLRRLRSMSGREFDRTYAQMMVEDHQKDVAEFEMEARLGKNSWVRDFARRTLPTLRSHLRMAQMLKR